MKKIKINFLYLFLLFIIVACGDDDGGGSSTTQMTQAVTTLNAKVNSLSDLVDADGSSLLLTKNINERFALAESFSNVWTKANGVVDLSSDGGFYTLKEWFVDEFNPEFTNTNGASITFGGRLSGALNIFCYLGRAGIATDSSNLPTVGTQTATITPAIASACGEGGEDEESFNVTITTTETTDDTLYDRFLSIEIEDQESCPFKFYARVSSTEINIAQAEDQSCDGRDQASRTVFNYDITNQKARFFYISQAFSNFPGGFEIYRGYLDEVADKAYIVGSYGSDQDGTSANLEGIGFTAVGKPEAGGLIALSIKSINSNNIGDATYEGCVNSTSMAVTADGSLNCTVTGVNVDTPYTNVVQGQYDNNTARSDIYNINETTAVGFTDESDMFN